MRIITKSAESQAAANPVADDATAPVPSTKLTTQGETARDLLQRFDRMVSERGNYESNWQEAKDLVRPAGADFNRQNAPGSNRVDKIFDGTAMQSNNEFAGGLHSYLTPQTERWFKVSPHDAKLSKDKAVLKHCEDATDIILSEYSRPISAFYTAIHEDYLDTGTFGTCILYQDFDAGQDSLRFRSIPLADCYIEEDFQGQVDTVARRVKWTARQAIQRFGKENVPETILKKAEMDSGECFEFIHYVYPRVDYDPSKADVLNRVIASVWVSRDFQTIVEESGFYSMPYHVARWLKLAGEKYGYGCALACLPDIRTVNKLTELTIKAAQLAIAPPLQVPSESFMAPINTRPWGLNFYDRDNDARIEPIPMNTNPQITDNVMQGVKDAISKAFFTDYIRAEQKKERQTAFEIADNRDEMLRLMGPQLSRMMMELLGPAIARSYDLLVRAGKIIVPPQLQGLKFKIDYISPAAQAQLASKYQNLGRWVQSLVPIMQIDPNVAKIINTYEFAAESARALNVPLAVVNDQATYQAAVAQATNSQNNLNNATAGAQIAGAAKDLATAHSTMASAGAPPLSATP